MSKQKKKLFIIDGHAHIFAAYYAPMRQKLESPTGEPTKATYIFTRTLESIIKNYKPDMLVMAMETKTKSFRAEMYEDYKANRPPMPEDLPKQIDRIEEILDAFHIPVLRHPTFEADDIIGTLSKKAAKEGDEVYICSKDKDMLQLINDHVITIDVQKGDIIDEKKMVEKYDMRPDQFIDCLALQGDSSDNIPGVPDVGPKTAVNWIKKYGSLENLYEHADEIKGRRGKSLRENKEQAFLSKKLVTIETDIPMNIDYEKFKLKEPDKKRLSDIFTELGFQAIAKEMDIPLKKNKIKNQNDHALGTPLKTASLEDISCDYQLVDTEEKFENFCKELKKQKIFAIDTETTSMDPMKADLVGLSFSWKKHQAFYIPIKAPLGQNFVPIENIKEKLGPILADEKVKKIGQNIKYDINILKNASLDIKGIYFDTMIASYCLNPERRNHSMDKMAKEYLYYECMPITSLIGKGKNQLSFDMVDTESASLYAAEDADITFLLYKYLDAQLDKHPDTKELFQTVEMPLVSCLAQMERNGIALEVPLLKKMSLELSNRVEEISEEIYELAGEVFNIGSPKQLAEILFDKIGLEPVKYGKTGRSTDASVLDELSGQHDIIDLILEYRMLTKLQNTYVDKLGQLINPRTHRVHASFNQTGTVTGRLSSSDPNLQNIPIRTELGRKIRAAFVPGNKENCILAADYSQIELRLLAHFSKDRALLNAFKEGRDIHTFVASQVFDLPLDKVTKDMRAKAKGVNFGIIYGQGPFALAKSLGISRTEAKDFIDQYYSRYSSIKKFMNDLIEKAGKTGYAETILHRKRKIANIKSKNHFQRSQAERFAVNTTIQGSAADLIKVAMINIHRRIEKENLPVKMLLQIHDELVFELPEKESENHAEWITEEMSTAIDLEVPLKIDVETGKSWLAE